jgi:hypothetical protein
MTVLACQHRLAQFHVSVLRCNKLVWLEKAKRPSGSLQPAQQTVFPSVDIAVQEETT